LDGRIIVTDDLHESSLLESETAESQNPRVPPKVKPDQNYLILVTPFFLLLPLLLDARGKGAISKISAAEETEEEGAFDPYDEVGAISS
jgi:hypothetical protein